MYVIHSRIISSVICSSSQRTGFPKCPSFVLLPLSFLPTLILLGWSELELEGWAIIYFLPAGLVFNTIFWKFSLANHITFTSNNKMLRLLLERREILMKTFPQYHSLFT